ncbi:MAG: D-alanine--D-alanine ligase [Gammaproteobacteria bacterium]|nr:D-alanine--D-alanine ligase [Gammaproteobacteria bacterium]MYF39143.1 D-alanine--D-alanine ligase [Gammaproteobacteria bacterium]
MFQIRTIGKRFVVTKIAVIGGGCSAEAEVSRSSAAQVTQALERTFTVKYFELSQSIATELIDFAPSVVFPVLHGFPGEDGTVQGLLSILGYPFVGSDTNASVISINKALSKFYFDAAGLPVLPQVIVTQESLEADIIRVTESFGDRVVCKPMHGGSALGVVPLPSGGDVRKALTTSLVIDNTILVEPFVEGREITVGVLDLHHEQIEALPVTEILVAKDEWYDYTNRYTPGRSEHVIPADIDDTTTNALQTTAIRAHQSVGCRDLSRVDFILEPNGTFWVLEVNNIPGMTPTSLYPDAAQVHGISFQILAEKLVSSASRRGSDLGELK